VFEILLALFLAAVAADALRVRLRSRRRAAPRPTGARPFAAAGRQYRRHYGRRGFLKLGGAVLAAGALVYSGADALVEARHAGGVRSRRSDRAAALFKHFGERFWFGFWGGFMLLDALLASTPLTRWGRRSFEAMAVGLPALWTTQRVLGASRPTDGDEDPAHVPDPRWRPFADDNSASGHAFMAAIPWLTLARRPGPAPARAAAALASLPTAWSRLNDRKHFLSQIVLGYSIAWQAVGTVAAGEETPRRPAADGAEEKAAAER